MPEQKGKIPLDISKKLPDNVLELVLVPKSDLDEILKTVRGFERTLLKHIRGNRKTTE